MRDRDFPIFRHPFLLHKVVVHQALICYFVLLPWCQSGVLDPSMPHAVEYILKLGIGVPASLAGVPHTTPQALRCIPPFPQKMKEAVE